MGDKASISNQAELSLDDKIAKRNIKDSVFTNLFHEKKYVFELYLALFPSDIDSTVDDIETITLEYDLVNEYYNDLGFLVGDQLIVLVEAQSEWSDNIIVRVFLYLAQTWKNYIDAHDDMDLHSTKKVVLPKPELFVIYTGDKRNVKDVVSYSEDFLGEQVSAVDIRVKVIRDGKDGDIINQYVKFTKVLAEQVKLYGRTRKSIVETIRICKDQNVLRDYFQEREEEVVSIMIALYDYENSLNKKIKFERNDAKEEQARDSAKSMHEDGLPVETIAKYLHYNVEKVREWLGLVPAVK